MGITIRQCDLIEGYTGMITGIILLIQVIYAYFKARHLNNVIFMNTLLLIIFLICLISIYAGIYNAFKRTGNWAGTQTTFYIDTFVNITYEICTALITWIVGFKFIDSATKLELIETHFEKRQEIKKL